MAEVTREVIHDRTRTTSPATWLALILAILALIIAWLAYNRSGQDLETKIQNQINESLNDAQRTTNQAQDRLNTETGN